MHIHASRADGHASAPPRKMPRRIGIGIAAVLVTLLSGCFIPDGFDLEIDVPNSGEVGWKFDGKWQLFLPGYDPRRETIPAKDLIAVTADLGKLPGTTSVTHLEKNVWKQSIAWQVRLRDSQNRPAPVFFPTGGAADYWLVRIIPEEKAVLLETVAPPTGQDLAAFVSMGYKSAGTLTIKTSGTLTQLSGPQLSKGWFSSSYSTKWGVLEGQPIRVRIKW
jgi:hypothetical protein